MGWGPFGAPGWGYDMVSPPGPNLLSGPTGLAPCVFALRRDDVGLQVAHMRAALAAAMYTAPCPASCAPPGARSRTKPVPSLARRKGI